MINPGSIYNMMAGKDHENKKTENESIIGSDYGGISTRSLYKLDRIH